jgi:hypothetical protein
MHGGNKPTIRIMKVAQAPMSRLASLRIAHLPTKQRLRIDRQVRCGMTPILEYRPTPRGSWNCHSIVRTQPCEERQFLTSHEHIYRIDLHSTKTRKGCGYMPLRDGARWSCSIKSLRSKRNASCLVDRQ